MGVDILSDAIYEVFEPIGAVALTNEEWERGESDGKSKLIDCLKKGFRRGSSRLPFLPGSF
jgi:hypothetical protein